MTAGQVRNDSSLMPSARVLTSTRRTGLICQPTTASDGQTSENEPRSVVPFGARSRPGAGCVSSTASPIPMSTI